MKCDPPSNKYTHDKDKRLHFTYPRSGPIHVTSRSAKFTELTIEQHVNDLLPILEDCRKSIIVLVVDGGPDWQTASWPALYCLYRLFLRLDLDILCVTSYAPHHSAFNPIEHAWSFLSRQLRSVTLPAVLPGDTRPPCALSGITHEERETKEKQMFDIAIDQLNQHWNGKLYNGYPVHASSTSSIRPAYNDYHHIKKVCTGSKKLMHQNPDV